MDCITDVECDLLADLPLVVQVIAPRHQCCPHLCLRGSILYWQGQRQLGVISRVGETEELIERGTGGLMARVVELRAAEPVADVLA